MPDAHRVLIHYLNAVRHVTTWRSIIEHPIYSQIASPDELKRTLNAMGTGSRIVAAERHSCVCITAYTRLPSGRSDYSRWNLGLSGRWTRIPLQLRPGS